MKEAKFLKQMDKNPFSFLLGYCIGIYLKKYGIVKTINFCTYIIDSVGQINKVKK
jgi:hypothetical protein